MARARSHKTAVATDTMEAETLPPGATDFEPEEYESAAHAMEASRAREHQEFQAGHHVENGERPKPSHAEDHAPSGSDAGTVGRREFKKAADPLGVHTIMLSPDPKGPKARLLRSNDNGAMLIQFSENPGKEITDQIREAGFRWERRAESDFSKGRGSSPWNPATSGAITPARSRCSRTR